MARDAVWGVRRLGGLRRFRMPLDSLALPHGAVRALMQLWRRMHWSSGDGMMPPPELLAVYRLAYHCQAAGDFVELGAWRGLTTAYLATACRARGRGRVIAVDTFAGTREHDTHYKSVVSSGGSTLEDFQRTIARADVTDWVTPCMGYTTAVAGQHARRRVAFLLIDADHSYPGVKADFEAWFPMVAPGGTVMFHDYAMPDGEVRAYVDREIRSRADLVAVPGVVVPNIYAATRRRIG